MVPPQVSRKATLLSVNPPQFSSAGSPFSPLLCHNASPRSSAAAQRSRDFAEEGDRQQGTKGVAKKNDQIQVPTTRIARFGLHHSRRGLELDMRRPVALDDAISPKELFPCLVHRVCSDRYRRQLLRSCFHTCSTERTIVSNARSSRDGLCMTLAYKTAKLCTNLFSLAR